MVRERWVCSRCSGDRVQYTAWVWANTGKEADSDPPTYDTWCDTCRDMVAAEIVAVADEDRDTGRDPLRDAAEQALHWLEEEAYDPGQAGIGEILRVLRAALGKEVPHGEDTG